MAERPQQVGRLERRPPRLRVRRTKTPGGTLNESATRSFPGGRPAAAENGSSGTGARSASTSMAPPHASRNSAASATVRVIGPRTDMPCQPSAAGALDTRPRAGLSPNSPQHEAGMRIEPAPSEPNAAPTRPAATAAAEPPLDPPGVCPSDHGLRVVPNASVSVNGCAVSSGTWVLPMTIAPAARSRRTTSASRSAGG